MSGWLASTCSAKYSIRFCTDWMGRVLIIPYRIDCVCVGTRSERERARVSCMQCGRRRKDTRFGISNARTECNTEDIYIEVIHIQNYTLSLYMYTYIESNAMWIYTNIVHCARAFKTTKQRWISVFCKQLCRSVGHPILPRSLKYLFDILVFFIVVIVVGRHYSVVVLRARTYSIVLVYYSKHNLARHTERVKERLRDRIGNRFHQTKWLNC